MFEDKMSQTDAVNVKLECGHPVILLDGMCQSCGKKIETKELEHAE